MGPGAPPRLPPPLDSSTLCAGIGVKSKSREGLGINRREQQKSVLDVDLDLLAPFSTLTMTSTGQSSRVGPTGVALPASPRSTLPGYIRRSSTAMSNHTPSSSSASVRNSTIPNTPSSSSTVVSQYFSNVVVSSTAGPDILDRPRDRSRNSEVNSSALAFLFAEMVSYTQNRVSGISDLEKK
jgi:hypothetical protein